MKRTVCLAILSLILGGLHVCAEEPECSAYVQVIMEEEPYSDGEYYYRADNCGIRIRFTADTENCTDSQAIICKTMIDGREDLAKYTEMPRDGGISEIEYYSGEIASALRDGEHKIETVCCLEDGTEIPFFDRESEGVFPETFGYRFILDTVCPEAVFCAYAPEAARKEPDPQGQRYYFNAEFEACVKIRDEYADSGCFVLLRGEYTGKCADASAVRIEKFEELCAFDTDGDTYIGTDCPSRDGIYRYSAAGCDRAGNPMVFKEGFDQDQASSYLILDRTPPRGFVSVYENGNLCYRMDEEGQVLYSEPMLRGREAVVEWACDPENEMSPVAIRGSLITSSEKTKQVFADEYCFGQTVSCAVKGPCSFYVSRFRLEDLAGNQSESIASDRIFLDSVSPSVSLSFSKEPSYYAGGVPIYSEPAEIILSASDPEESGGTGIGDVYIEVTEGGNDACEERRVLHKSIRKAYEARADEEKRIFNFKKKHTLDGSFYSDCITVRAVVYDNAGNSREAGIRFGMDQLAPALFFRTDADVSDAGRYSSRDISGEIVVRERHFNEDLVLIRAEGGADISDWKNSGTDEWRCTVLFDTEGEHSLSVRAGDLLGNESGDVELMGRFLIDKTRPELRIFGVKRAEEAEEALIPGSRIFTREYKELRAEAVDGLELYGDEFSVHFPDGRETAPEFENGIFRVPLDEEGTYCLEGRVRDAAGNSSIPWEKTILTVDRTPPEIVIEGVRDGMSTDTEPEILVKVSDSNIRKDLISVKLTGGSGEDTPIPVSEADENGTVTVSAMRVCEDGIYRLTCRAEDPAGNKREENAVFTVNRSGPSFHPIEPGDGENVISGSLRPKIAVQDIDSVSLVSAMINGEEAACTYRDNCIVFDDELTEDGKYVITAEVSDLAGHLVSMKPIEFMIDRTPPSLLIDAEGGIRRRYLDKVSFLFVSDDPDAEFAELTLDGKDIREKVLLKEGKGYYTVPAENRGKHTLRASLSDAAGNRGEIQTVRFTVGKEKPVGPVLLLLATGVVFIMYNRSRASKKEAGK